MTARLCTLNDDAPLAAIRRAITSSGDGQGSAVRLQFTAFGGLCGAFGSVVLTAWWVITIRQGRQLAAQLQERQRQSLGGVTGVSLLSFPAIGISAWCPFGDSFLAGNAPAATRHPLLDSTDKECVPAHESARNRSPAF